MHGPDAGEPPTGSLAGGLGNQGIGHFLSAGSMAGPVLESRSAAEDTDSHRHSRTVIATTSGIGNHGLAALQQRGQTASDGPLLSPAHQPHSSPPREPGSIRSTPNAGVPLDNATRTEMETGFGRDLARVRIHTDANAARSAASIHASAYTVGNHIYFGHKGFQPNDDGSKHLLAHELAHVLQQQQDGVTDPLAAGAHEDHADRAATQLLAGRTNVAVGPGTLVGVARKPDDETPVAPKRITGKQEGSGQAIKPIVLDGHAYSYIIWGEWQQGDNVEKFRERILGKWVTWRFKGITTPERQAVISYLKASRFVPFDTTQLTPGNSYSLPLEDAVVSRARVLSGEPAREKADKQAADEAGGEGAVKDTAKNGPGGVTASGEAPQKKEGSETGDPADPSGEKDFQVTSRPDVLADNPALAQMYINFLQRYAGVKAASPQPDKGLTRDQIKAMTDGNDRAKVVTDVFTQGWAEYQAAGGGDVITFGLMEETLFTQRARGNFTALHNQLEYSKEPEGLGLYKRGTILRYYDSSGQPIPKNVGGYRDPGYRTAAPPEQAARIPITDRGLLSVLQGIKNVTLDEQVLIYQAAKGHWDNKDLLYPAILDGWNGAKAVMDELHRQLEVVVVFLGISGVAAVLKRMQDPKAKGAGLLLEEMLKLSGKFFHFVFAAEVLQYLYSAGLELSKIQRGEGGELDALSKEHLNRAVVTMRELLTQLIAAGLTAAIVATAKSTAKTLSIPPKGGGGGLVPAPATRPAVGGSGGAAAAAPPPTPGFITPSLVPRPPEPLESRGGGTKEAPKEQDPTPESDTERRESDAERRARIARRPSDKSAPVQPGETPQQAKERTDKALRDFEKSGKTVDKITGEVQDHHVVSNKAPNSPAVRESIEILENARTSPEEPDLLTAKENRVDVEDHGDAHGENYHVIVRNRLKAAVAGKTPHTPDYREAVLSALRQIKLECQTKGTRLNLMTIKRNKGGMR